MGDILQRVGVVRRVTVGPVEAEGPPVVDDGEALPDDAPCRREDPRTGARDTEAVDGRVAEGDAEVVTERPVTVTVHSYHPPHSPPRPGPTEKGVNPRLSDCNEVYPYEWLETSRSPPEQRGQLKTRGSTLVLTPTTHRVETRYGGLWCTRSLCPYGVLSYTVVVFPFRLSRPSMMDLRCTLN